MDPKFSDFQRRFQRIFDGCRDEDFNTLIAACAFQLSIALAGMPDEFFVTPIADASTVTDAEIDAENAWNDALDRLFRAYL